MPTAKAPLREAILRRIPPSRPEYESEYTDQGAIEVKSHVRRILSLQEQGERLKQRKCSEGVVPSKQTGRSLVLFSGPILADRASSDCRYS